jgi:hypothetical protein
MLLKQVRRGATFPVLLGGEEPQLPQRSRWTSPAMQMDEPSRA